ncbi:MAG: hypothetical protein L0H96_19905 [Humibacillus sp.]|nr:hypothetical protein [Humibacillus sp.]MDN5779162.1 hypothetical protein [Humibacillus sp.]
MNDLRDRLSDTNPMPGDRPYPPEVAAAIVDSILAQVNGGLSVAADPFHAAPHQGSPAALSHRAGRRRWVIAAAATTALVAGAGSAAAWVVASRPDDPYGGYCSRSVTLDEDVWKQTGFTQATDAQGHRDVPDAIGSCATAWRMGIMTDPANASSTANHPVPELTACVVDDVLVIYPGNADTCRRLGVPDLKN